MISIPKTIDESINLAAELLPPLFEITITIEKHGYAVKLIDPECSEIDCDGGDGIRSDIIDGIEKAIEAAKRQGGE